MRKPSFMVGHAEGICGGTLNANPRPYGATVRPARQSAAHGSTRALASKPAATPWWLGGGAPLSLSDEVEAGVVDLKREVEQEGLGVEETRGRSWGRR